MASPLHNFQYFNVFEAHPSINWDQPQQTFEKEQLRQSSTLPSEEVALKLGSMNIFTTTRF